MPEAQRTLVKSPPELWTELSDPQTLARHLGEFGEIKITRVEPETTVAWEGDRARGTVELEPSGWGTRVTLTAEPSASEQERFATIRRLRRRVISEGDPDGVLSCILDDLGAARDQRFKDEG